MKTRTYTVTITTPEGETVGTTAVTVEVTPHGFLWPVEDMKPVTVDGKVSDAIWDDIRARIPNS